MCADVCVVILGMTMRIMVIEIDSKGEGIK